MIDGRRCSDVFHIYTRLDTNILVTNFTGFVKDRLESVVRV